MLPRMGVISVTARVLLEFEELIRPLNGRSRAFNVLEEYEKGENGEVN